MVEGNRLDTFGQKQFIELIHHLKKRGVFGNFYFMSLKTTIVIRATLPPNFEGKIHTGYLFVAPYRKLDVIETQFFRMAFRCLALAFVFPNSGMSKVFVIASGLTVGSLIFLPKMPTARFPSFESIKT